VKKFIRDLFNIPNSISLVRLVATPFIPWLWFSLDRPDLTLALGIFVGVTDLFDGILARKLNQMTELGAMLDQLGDLIFESIVLLLAVLSGKMWMGWLVIYLFREFLVSTVRTWVMSNGGKLPSSWIGKAKSSLIQYGFFLFFTGAILMRPDSAPSIEPIVGFSPGRLILEGGCLSIFTGILVGLLSAYHYLRTFVEFYISKSKTGGVLP